MQFMTLNLSFTFNILSHSRRDDLRCGRAPLGRLLRGGRRTRRPPRPRPQRGRLHRLRRHPAVRGRLPGRGVRHPEVKSITLVALLKEKKMLITLQDS